LQRPSTRTAKHVEALTGAMCFFHRAKKPEVLAQEVVQLKGMLTQSREEAVRGF
jgi:hypothetical protein